MLTLISSSNPTRWEKTQAFVKRKPWHSLAMLAFALLLLFGLTRLLRSSPSASATTATATAGMASVSGASNAAAAQPGLAQRAALAVTSVQVVVAQLPIKLVANGNLAARNEAVLGAEVNGLRIEKINASVGDWVEAGQVLVQFAAEQLRAEVAQAQAGVNEAQANANEATANAKRARGLQDSGAMSAQQISQFLATEQSALARLESTKAGLNVQQVRLKQTQLTAPDSGLITARNANLGAVVSPGLELFRMIRQGQLEWRAEVTASELSRIKAGTAVSINVSPNKGSNSNGNVLGQVRMVGPSVDTQSRNAVVYVNLNRHPDLRAGMFVRGELSLGQQQVLALPYSSVVMRDGFSYVMLIEGKDSSGEKARVRLQKVELGQRALLTQGEVVEVRSGLTAGAAVVAKGAAFLTDGDTVKLVNETAAKP
jgi:HlyD family secretion protein